MSARKVLIVAYYYPPGGGVGVQRALKFSKYLPQFGWQPIVLTADSPLGIPLDPALEVPEGIAVYRAAPTMAFDSVFATPRSLVSRALSAGLLVPDAFIGWLPAAFRRGMEAIRTHRPEVILASSPPNSSQLLGWALAWKSGLPFVADFRDAWVTDPDRNRSLHNRLRLALVERGMEARVVRSSARVISVSQGILDDFRVRYPSVPRDHFILIENGFDEADFAGLQSMDLGPFSIVVTGSMNKPHRSAAPLLRGVGALVAGRPELRARLRVHLVGPEDPADRVVAEQAGIAALVSFAGWVSHRAALSYQSSADVNVMVWDGPDDERSSQMMSSKVFEYIGAGRPILGAVSAASAAAAQLRPLAHARVVAPADAAGIAAALAAMADAPRAPVPTTDLARFTRRHQSQQLAHLLDAVAAGR